MTKLVIFVLLLAVITFGVGFGYLTGGDDEQDLPQNSVTVKKSETAARTKTTSPNVDSTKTTPAEAVKSEADATGNPALAPAAPAAAAATSGSFSYRFRKGDTVGKVLRTLGRPQSDINRVIDMNPGLDIERIPVGATVRLPGSPGALPAAPDKPVEVARLSTPSEYSVRPGDTLSRISNKMYGDPRKWKRIAKANPGVNPNTIRVGQKLSIPR